MRTRVSETIFEIRQWWKGWFNYVSKKLNHFGVWFEKHKDVLVDFLIARRGGYQRPFLHFSLGVLFIVGVMSAPLVASSNSNVAAVQSPSTVLSSLDLLDYGIQTQQSDKPRDQVYVYTVEKGDTLSTLGVKFGVSLDTIRWSNDLNSDSLSIGQKIKIPPVTGVVHKVRDGETVQSIAKKYKTDSQKIINFPFNDFSDLDTFSLAVGQTLIVPDGVIAQAAAVASSVQQSPVTTGGTGQYIWPTNGTITQYPIWYHMALDIANSSAPAVVAADSGTVTLVSYMRYGYGNYITVGHGEGYSSLYAHLSEIYVKAGDTVSRGQVIGRMGSTGRSTGTHLHFEIRRNGVAVSPLPYLK